LNLKSIQKPIFTSLLLALFDNYIKYLIRVNNVQENEIIQNILTIDLTYNTGIAFGLLSEKTKITFFVSLGVLIWLILQFNKVQNESLEYYSLVLILGGAFGNLGERGYNLIFSNNGKVTDFIELLFIPSFNLADSFISIGIFLLIITELQNKKS
jgi:signal peptidase II